MALPQHDTTRFLDDFRTAQISHLLTAATTRFDVGKSLTDGPKTFTELRDDLSLAERSAIVLFTGLRSIGLIDVADDGQLYLTEYGREKMSPSSPFHLRGYVGLGAFSADVQNMVSCLEADRPAGDVSFVYHEGEASALDDPNTADLLTRAMADRARNVAPVLAENLQIENHRLLLDVGGAHGLYSYHLLKRFPDLRAIIIDREPALRVAKEYANDMNLSNRVEFLCEDIHTMEIPPDGDIVLMANILHDYNAVDASHLVDRFGKALPLRGKLMVLDSFLESVSPGQPPVSLGPRPVAAYSALLFSICEGRCYRFDEVEDWLRIAGLSVLDNRIELPAHGSVISAVKA